MPILFNGSSVGSVVFNDVSLSRVLYDGVEVFSAAKPSEFDFTLTAADLTQTIYLTQSAANAVTVDWGDGSATVNPSELSPVLTHSFPAAGSYTVKVSCAVGESWFPGGDDAITTFTGTWNASPRPNGLTSVRLESPCSAQLNRPRRFFSCPDLTSLVIRSNAISDVSVSYAQNCAALASVELPATTNSILIFAFSNCISLKTLIVRAATPPTLNPSAMNNVPADCAIYVPAGSVEAYKAASGWSDRAAYIQGLVE